MKKLPRAALTLVFAISFAGCESSTIVEPDMDPSFARSGSAPVQSVSGGGTVDVTAGRSTYAFHASINGAGAVKGKFELHFSSSPTQVHGDVTCLVIDGNQAWLGGVITRSNDEGAFGVGGEIVWSAEDNGEGKNADPDRVSAFFGGLDADVCLTKFAVGTNEWSNGNVQIR